MNIDNNNETHSMSEPAPRLHSADMDMIAKLIYRQTALGGLGLTYNGQRDVYAQLGYRHVLTPGDYWNRYERGDIAERIIEAYPLYCWKDEPQIREITARGLERDNTAFVKQFRRLSRLIDEESGDEINLTSTFKRLDILMNTGRYAVLVIGLPGNPESPASRTALEPLGIAAVQYLQPFAEDDVEIAQWDNDPQSRRYGKPLLYRIYPSGRLGHNRIDGNMPSIIPSRLVHWTRIIHVAEGYTKNPLYGKPRLQAVMNRLEDLEKVIGGGAEAFWKNADRGIHADLRDGYEFGKTPDGQDTYANLYEQVQRYANRLTRLIVTSGVDIKHLGSEVADPKNAFDVIASVIAGTLRMPKRILFGSELGQLASSQDQINWYEQIDARRQTLLTPDFIRRFINRLQYLGILPATPYGYSVNWPTSDPLTQQEKTDLEDKSANTKLRLMTMIEKMTRIYPQIANDDNVIRYVAMQMFDLRGDQLEQFIRAVQQQVQTTTAPEEI